MVDTIRDGASAGHPAYTRVWHQTGASLTPSPTTWQPYLD
jgi:hypothetical protein